jgi:peptide/nickel transport system permease protein
MVAAWRTREGKIGLAILVTFLIVVVVGPAIAPYDPSDIGVGDPSVGMSRDHLLGTDSLGRDVMSRLLVGARSVIAIPLLATLLAFAVGGVLGMFAGYRGGHADAVISRGLEIALSLAPLLIVAVIITAAGTSTLVLVLSVAAVFAPRIARVLRGATQTVAVNDYVQAALARGERDLSIILREILPNIAPTVFVEFAVRLTYAIIFVATLNFLGLGLQPPSPNWGVMVAESRTTVTFAPLTTLAPAFAIGVVAIGISMIADGMTQALGSDVKHDLN